MTTLRDRLTEQLPILIGVREDLSDLFFEEDDLRERLEIIRVAIDEADERVIAVQTAIRSMIYSHVGAIDEDITDVIDHYLSDVGSNAEIVEKLVRMADRMRDVRQAKSASNAG